MSGRHNGVQANLKKIQPKCLYVHCSNHALDLVGQEVLRECDLLSDVSLIVRDVSKIIRESSKQRNLYESALEEEEEKQPLHLLALTCPTRWVVRVKAIKRFLDNFQRVIASIDDLLKMKASTRPEVRSKLRGYARKIQKPNFFS